MAISTFNAIGWISDPNFITTKLQGIVSREPCASLVGPAKADALAPFLPYAYEYLKVRDIVWRQVNFYCRNGGKPPSTIGDCGLPVKEGTGTPKLTS